LGGKPGCAGASVAVGAGVAAITKAQEAKGEVPVRDASNLVKNTATAKSTGALENKYCVLEGLAVQIREALVTSITQSIIQWINNGFEGGPSFVTNLKGFLGGVADQVSLDFIKGTDLGFLCSPFQLQVRLSLAVAQQPFSQSVQCSLGDVTKNIQGFLGGDFSQGGFPALFKMGIDIQDNPYGAYLLAKNELSVRIASAQNEEITKLNWGQGFFSKGECTDTQGVVGGIAEATDQPAKAPTNQQTCEALGGTWKINTPGTQINSTLAKWMGLGADQLALANQIDEIISALEAQLAQKVLTSLQGLSGLSSKNSSTSANGQSYLDQLTNSTSASAVDASRQVLITNLTAAVSLEDDYQSVLTNALTVLNDEKSVLATRYQCYVSLGGTGSSLNAQTASSTLSVVLDKQTQYQKAYNVSVNAVKQLTKIESDVEFAATTEDLKAAGNEFDAINQSGFLNTSDGLTLLEAAYDAEVAARDGLKAQTGDQCLAPTQ
jgi:hypothetical protein